MGVIALREHVEQEQNGETNLEFIGLRYVGNRSSLAVGNALNNQGQWPGSVLLNRGVTYFAVVPDEGLGYLDARDDLEVLYGAQEIAEAMLQKNFLPQNVFGRGVNSALRERVFDKLGLRPEVEAGPIEEQMHDVADVEDAEALDDSGNDRVSHLVEEHWREDLQDAAAALGMDDDDVDSAGKRDLAEYLADEDDQAVEAVLAGEEVPSADGPTTASLTDAYSSEELKAAVREVREDADEFSLRNVSAEDMASYLAGHEDQDAVDAALDAAPDGALDAASDGGDQ